MSTKVKAKVAIHKGAIAVKVQAVVAIEKKIEALNKNKLKRLKIKYYQ